MSRSVWRAGVRLLAALVLALGGAPAVAAQGVVEGVVRAGGAAPGRAAGVDVILAPAADTLARRIAVTDDAGGIGDSKTL